ncbi:50S ribosomal protein L25/general stress protein Ctc [Pararhizobium sp. IMCC21322]|uniref:50S ribosomal protein L25/general stress protein Ctc n=1 Tax=Pararhizobium sp. IMCC21322 TaxID=3067903 RepID=UPI0027416099|nr:50S ribosomal protein L25/general stress protein Ctc [Pararhizobium sp. IMCC21322]
MSDELKAVARERVGKGAARATRREGLVPGVIYGDKKPPLSIALPAKETAIAANDSSFMARVIDLDVDGKTHSVIAKDVQRDPVKDFVTHIDFLRVGKGSTLTVNVPVHFINEEAAPGLERGGVLNIVRHEVECEVPGNAVPESLEADLTGLDIGDGIHISAVKLPEGVVPTISDRDFTIATIAAPAALKSEDDDADAEDATDEDAEAEAEDGESTEE